MAEDVLRLSGFLEGVNYRRQATLAESGGRPDYTFLLPNGLVMHMDVKFPLDNYVRSLEAESELETRRFRDQFLRDVRDRVRELTTRGYLDDGTETVDCLLLFIPNEQVYAFVHEQDRSILDDALRHKIVLCSPLTLYAVLAVVRQAVDNFRLEKTSNEILALLGEFSLQWQKYVLQLEKVQQRFDAVGKEYAALMSTRHRALQRPLDKIEALRHEEPALTDTEIPPFATRGVARRGIASVPAMTQVTVLGGGQLGWMLGLAGLPLGVRCTFLDPAEAPTAGMVGSVVRGGLDDLVAAEQAAEGARVDHVRVGGRARRHRAAPRADRTGAAAGARARGRPGPARREGGVQRPVDPHRAVPRGRLPRRPGSARSARSACPRC